MASINKVILIGNLGQDPETRYMPDGSAVTRVSLATTDAWKDKNGEKQEKTEWHRVVFYRKLAEIAGEYLKKGRPIYVEGRLQTKKWTDKQNIERYTTEIVATEMKMLGSATKQSDSSEQPQNHTNTAGAGNASPSTGRGFDDMEEDIPF